MDVITYPYPVSLKPYWLKLDSFELNVCEVPEQAETVLLLTASDWFWPSSGTSWHFCYVSAGVYVISINKPACLPVSEGEGWMTGMSRNTHD